MVFISKEDKNAKAVLLRALGKKYGVSLTVARHNHSTIVLNISKGKIDFFSDYNFCGISQQFLNDAFKILNNGNYNNSDSMIDYFDIGFYIDINIGKFRKPYLFINN